MANLDYVERDLFIKLFEQHNGSGYVLDFSNRTFQEFIYEKMEIDIYQKYPNLSKAKIIKAIMKDFDDVTVGKLLLELLRYMQLKDMVNDTNCQLFKNCANVGNKLIGKSIIIKEPKQNMSDKPIETTIDFDKFLNDISALINFEDSPQSRGFQFEKFLKSFLEANLLSPRGSFKILGEQIDGSFTLHNDVYLLEAKWTNKLIDKAELVIFNEKVLSKSTFTRGLFISFSGYSQEALATFSNGRNIGIVLMTVQELVILISNKQSFQEILWKKVRALAEEGAYYKPIYEL